MLSWVRALSRPGPDGREGADLLLMDSTNEAFCTLMREGLRPMLGYVEDQLAGMQPQHEVLSEKVLFLVANPAADLVRPSDLPAGRRVEASWRRSWLHGGGGLSGPAWMAPCLRVGIVSSWLHRTPISSEI